MRLGSNYFVTCAICGMPGHRADQCSLKAHYHQQAIRQLAHGSQDAEILREVYGKKKERPTPLFAR
jgi:hypothetical protein